MSSRPAGTLSTARKADRALVAGLRLPSQSESEVGTSAREMVRLANTLGIGVVGMETQSRSAPSPSSYLGSGKVSELRSRIDGESEGAALDLVLVDGELTPRQQHTLEEELGVPVLDRTAVILEIFESRARTREARLEVEMARLRYELPRLRETAAGDDRHGGGGRGGRGHTNLELEKERIRSRLRELESELDAAAVRAEANRSREGATFRVALVGYTNAGKSSIMRGLSASDGLVEDKLFATLGTTARRLDPPSAPPIIVSDTVGFVSRLPHELVASFRSTLDEAREADHLLLVVDASDPAWREQLEVTRTTLEEIGAGRIPWTLVLNKCDRLAAGQRGVFEKECPGALRMSALDPDDIRRLRARLEEVQDRGLSEEWVLVPFAQGGLLAEIHEGARVVEVGHSAEGTRLRVRASPAALDRWRAQLPRSEPTTSPASLMAIGARYGLELSTVPDGAAGPDPHVDDSGLDYRVVHAMDDAGRRWVVRGPRRQSVVRASRVEGRALRFLRDRLPVAIPDWRIHAPELIAYPRLPGTPAWTLTDEGVRWNGIDPERPPRRLLSSLAGVLARLERIPETELRSAGIPVHPIDEIRGQYRAMIERTESALEPEAEVLQRWHAWLDDDGSWPERPTLIHGDLHPGHLLLDDDARVVGILDWSEVQVGDPGRDLSMLVGCFGAGALRTVLDALEEAGSSGWPERGAHAIESWAFNPVRMADWAIAHGDESVLSHARAQLGSIVPE